MTKRRKVAWPPWPAQREMLYALEDQIGYGGFFSTVEACQGVIDRMLRSAWYQERSPIRFVRAVYPVYGMSGFAKLDPTHGEIGFYASRLCERSLMHEMAHPLVHCRTGTTLADHEWDHSPEFVGALLLLYRRFNMASTADQLQKLFDSHDVRYWPEARIHWVGPRQ